MFLSRFIYTYTLVRRVLSWRKDIYIFPSSYENTHFWYTCHEYVYQKRYVRGKSGCRCVASTWDRYYYRFGSFDIDAVLGNPKNVYTYIQYILYTYCTRAVHTVWNSSYTKVLNKAKISLHFQNALVYYYWLPIRSSSRSPANCVFIQTEI